jgi:phage terminase large subunit
MPEIEFIGVHRPLSTAKTRYVLDYGGRGSGKSVAASQTLLEHGLQRKGRMLVVRKVGRTLRLSVFPRLLTELSKWNILQKCKVNKQDMAIVLPNGTEINCIGADDPEKIKSVEDAWFAWIEEADALTEQDFDSIDYVLRSGGDRILLTFNPPPAVPGVPHWIKKRFIDNADDSSTVLKTTWRDNPFLPASYVERLEALKTSNPELYRMWALGEFVGLSGAIFKNWGIVDEIPENAEFIGYGLDFGFSVDPAALIASYRYNGEFYHREIIYATDLTNADLIHEMESVGIGYNEDIIADSAEPKSIEELRRAGFFVRPAVKGPDSVRAGVDFLRGFRHNIEKGSSGLIAEFGTYSWKTGSDGKQKPQPIDAYNHGIDAIRYRCYTPPTGGVETGFSASDFGF